METQINISLVYGGFILTTPTSDEDTSNAPYKTEVFTSQGKLMKALRTAIEANSLMAKSKDEKETDVSE